MGDIGKDVEGEHDIPSNNKKAFLMPTVTYGAETWSLNAQERKELGRLR